MSLNLFIPITKIDAQKRLVYGTLTEEVPDKSGEIIDYATTKTAYQKWSDEASERSKGKSKGNLRAMHGSVAAGRFEEIVFDDDNKRIEGVAKVVDDDEWTKVLEGVYTGFSHGGEYAKRWKDPEQPHLTRYTPELAEVSLVDNPCCPTATFEFVKEDGSKEMRKFNTHTEEHPVMDNTATAEGEAKDTTTMNKDNRPQNKGGVRQVWEADDGSTHNTKAEALQRNVEFLAKQQADAQAAPALDALAKLDQALGKNEEKGNDEAAPVQSEAKDEKQPETVAKADENGKEATPSAERKVEGDLRKGLGEVARMACLIQELDWFQQCLEMEADWERDNSPLPAELKSHIGDLCSFLRSLVEEETAELFDEDDLDVMEMAAGLPAGHIAALSKFAEGKEELGKAVSALQKAGARHSKTDLDRVQKIHDDAHELHKCMGEVAEKCADMHKAAAEMKNTAIDLGATGDKADEGGEDDANKLATGILAKLTAERDALGKVLTDLTPKFESMLKRVEAQTTLIEGQNKRIEDLEKQPMPPKASVRVVEKGGAQPTDDDVLALLKGKTPEEVNMLVMKAALSNPITHVR